MKTLPLIAALVAAVTMILATTTAMAAPCHPGHRRPCALARPAQVVFVETESSKIRLVRIEGAVDAQNETINTLVGSHNDLVGRVTQDRTASQARDNALRTDLDREVEERRAIDDETSALILDGIDADEEIGAKATEAEARAAAAAARAERLERELRALKAAKKEKK